MRRRKVKHLKLKLIGNELTDGQYNTVHSLDGGMKKGERELLSRFDKAPVETVSKRSLFYCFISVNVVLFESDCDMIFYEPN
jgi:hypothetical protein